MASTFPANPTPATVNNLLVKLGDNDPDFRFMALSDLIQVLNNCKPDILTHDYNTAARSVDNVVRALDDQNGEVQNLAIKCLGPLVEKLPMSVVGPMIEKLSNLKLKNSVDNSVPSLALRSVIEALPRPLPGITPSKEVLDSYNAISRVLLPRLLGRNLKAHNTGSVKLPAPPEGLLENAQDLNAEWVDVVIELVRCFGSLLQPDEVEALQSAIVVILETDRGSSVVKKRSVVAVSILAVYLSDDVLGSFITQMASALQAKNVSPVTRRLYLTIMGSMARSIPRRFGHYLPTLVSFIMSALSEEELQKHLDAVSEGHDTSPEFSEIREAALVALEAFLASCPNEMKDSTEDTLAACLRYLRYDPNYAVSDDEEMDVDEDDEDTDEMDEDEDFDDEEGFDDDDDVSWKVRRCAAKALYTIISTRSSGDLLESGLLYRDAAPALIKRFDEREENVRLEIISSMSLLIRKTGEGIIPLTLEDAPSETIPQLTSSRKRRRQSSSGASTAGLSSPVLEKIPSHGPRADLAKLTPQLVTASTKQLKGKLIPTKQAVINILDDLISVQQHGLAPFLPKVMDPILDAIKGTGAAAVSSSINASSGNATASASTLRIAALRLMSDIARTHNSEMLQPYLSKLVACVVNVAQERFYKLSAEALRTIEELVKTITPPRSRLTAQKYKAELQEMYDIIIDRTAAIDADTDVREKAIHALGILLSRTSGTEGAALLAQDKRRVALNYLLERVKNETTRLAAVRAIDNVAAFTSSSAELDAKWTREVVVELAAQLRKANRSLRGSSAQALKHLILSPAAKGNLDGDTIQSLVSSMLPVVSNNDAHLLGPALLVLAQLAQEDTNSVVTPQLISGLCELLKKQIAGSVLDALLVLVTNIGQSGAGQILMTGLLQNVGINGDPAAVGKVIGTLLVYSGASAGVTIDGFINEIKTQPDPARKSLALAILGEAGRRLGQESPLEPELFLQQFDEDFDKVSVSAAVALGRAGAGNVPRYLPVILAAMQKQGSIQYLLLQSIKEILQEVNVSSVDIGDSAPAIWKMLLKAAELEDNRAVCAECMGRMALFEPRVYMPKLEDLLRDDSSILRSIAVQAIRYTLPDSDESFDLVLKDHIINMLVTMLQDSDIEIRRLGLTALNAAAHNKPELILAHLNQLVGFVMTETHLRPELVREVQMGPFKHTVDDGLELRKSAYDTLYSLMETAFSRLSIIGLYDRIIAGLRDDNDIRGMCNLMVSKLVYLDPDETMRRLDAIAECFRATLSTKLKDTAVKQEVEKQNEANKSVLRVTLLLGEKTKSTVGSGANNVGSQHQTWSAFWDWVNKDFQGPLKALREEGVGTQGRLVQF